MQIEAILDRFPFVRTVSAEIRAEIRAMVRPVHLSPGQYFYRRGEACPWSPSSDRGASAFRALGESGREITLYHVTDGRTCLVNLVCAYLNSAATVTARAETEVDALVVPAGRFRSWVIAEPALLDYVFASISERMVDLMTLVEEIAFRRMDERLTSYLTGQFSGSPAQTLSTTHEEIAAELGTAREVVSRLLKDLERRGAVRIGRGRIELADSRRLNSDPLGPID